MHPEGEQDYWQQQDEGVGTQTATPMDSAKQTATTEAPITWEASEAIHHEKHPLWFMGVIGVAVVLVAISIFLQLWTFTALIIVMAIAVGVIGSRPPRVMQYQLTHQGLRINDKAFPFHDFRAFGLIEDGPLFSVVLIPRKRFMPGVNVYFPTDDGEEIVDVFGSVLPMERVEPDLVDKLSRKLHL